MANNIQEELIEKQRLYPTIIRDIFNSYYNLTDYVDISTYGATRCLFHNDINKPSAKLFFDDDGVERLWCFVCKKQFTAYDYVKLILKENPLTVLLKDISETELRDVLNDFLSNPNALKTRKSKLSNVAYKDLNVEDFVELISLGSNNS